MDSTWILILTGSLIGVLIYYTLMVRTILDMLSYKQETPPILVSFAFVGMIFLPFLIILGINVMIVWQLHKKRLSK